MKKIITVALLIIIVTTGILLSFNLKHRKKYLNEISPFHDTIVIKIRVNGSVEPRNRLEIKPQVQGRIENILVEEGQNVKKGQIVAWMSSTDRAALLDIARSKGPEEVKKWEDTYKPTPIISPINGFIISRNKEPGQSVNLNDVILVLADELIVIANIDETDLSYIKLNMEVSIFLDAYPKKKFNGIIEHISYESKIINNVTVYTVKIKPRIVPEIFRSGMSATVEIISQKKENILVLPLEAIIIKGNRHFVTVKKDKNKTETRDVITGISDGKNIEIISGVDERDTVILPEKSNRDTPSQIRGPGIPGIGRR